MPCQYRGFVAWNPLWQGHCASQRFIFLIFLKSILACVLVVDDSTYLRVCLQAHQVAQLEADEIASLQTTLHRMKSELDEERSLASELSAEITAKNALLAEADR